MTEQIIKKANDEGVIKGKYVSEIKNPLVPNSYIVLLNTGEKFQVSEELITEFAVNKNTTVTKRIKPHKN